jgi:hypothetical protein
VTVVVTPSEIPGYAVAGRDFSPAPIQLTFEDGNMNRLVPIPVLPGNHLATAGPFKVSMSLATGSPQGASLGSIRQALVVMGGNVNVTATVHMESVSRPQAGHCQVRFSGTSGQAYELQVSTDLRSWNTVNSGVLSSSTVQVSDPAGSETQRFYRVRITGPAQSPARTIPTR